MSRITTGLGIEPRRPVQLVRADLDHLGLRLEQQHRRAAHRADVDRLVRRVQHQHTTAGPTACAVGSIRAAAVDERHGPPGAGGTAVAIAGRSVDGGSGGFRPAAGTSRARARPRIGRASRRSRRRPSGRRGRTLEIAEEHVAAEPDAPRPRLDPSQVDRARRELREAGDEPAGRQVAAAPEDERGLDGGRDAAGRRRLRRRGRATRTGSRSRRRPRSARPARRAVERRGVAGPDRRVRRRPGSASPSATARTASAVDAAETTAAPAAARARKRAHWPVPAGASAPSGPRRARSARRRQAVADPCTISPTISTSGASNTSASSVAPTAPSREFSIGTSAAVGPPSWTARDDRADRREADVLGLSPAASSASCEFVPSARGTRPHQSSSTDGAALAGERAPDRLFLLGREHVLAAAAEHLLAVQPRRVAMCDRGEHDAVAVGVQQGERRRLAADSSP